MEYLTQKEFKRMFLNSFDKIEKNKEDINKINVFPVPDQDTGTNLTETLRGIKNVIEDKEFNNLEDFFKEVLDGALTAAQGNVGIIYTGFLAGFISYFQNNSVLDKQKVFAIELANALEEGAIRARYSIQNPKEGTILDVIDVSSKKAKQEVQENKDIVNLFRKIVPVASKAVIETQEKMEILKKANVVDAGALGFLMILESYKDSLEKEKEFSLIGEEKEKENETTKIKRFVQIISNRYEIVCLLENPRVEEYIIREKLKRLGDCLDLIHIGNKMKIHIHTDLPGKVKEIMRSIGDIIDLKEEDMAKQVSGNKPVKNISIGIVTDDLADLIPKIIDRYKIEIVNYNINWPEEKNLLGDNIYQKMINADKEGMENLPKTSQASPREFMNAYSRQLEKFNEILCIPLSSHLSGGYNSAIQARSMMRDPSKVHVIDSLQLSAGQALLVLKAIELIQEKRGINEIISELERNISKIYVYAFVNDPKWIEKGGRLTHSEANWIRRLQKIGLRPLLGLKDGKVEKLGIRFGSKDISGAIFKEIENKSKEIRKQGNRIRVVITHCDNLEEAVKLKDKLKKIKAEISFINLAGSVIGVHLGPGTLIASWTLLKKENHI